MKIEDVYKEEINDLIIKRGCTRFHITGIRHCDFKDKADEFIEEAARKMLSVSFFQEKANPYDHEAVSCRHGRKQIGYVATYDLEKYYILAGKDSSDHLTGHFGRFSANIEDHLLKLYVPGSITLDNISEYREEVNNLKDKLYGSWKHDAIDQYLVHSRHQNEAIACISQLKEHVLMLYGAQGTSTRGDLMPLLQDYKDCSQYDISLEGQQDRWDILLYLDYLHDFNHRPGLSRDDFFEGILKDVEDVISQIGGELVRSVSYKSYIERLTELVSTDLPSSEAAQHYLKTLPDKAFDDIRQQVESFPHHLYRMFHTNPEEFVRTLYYARIPRRYLDPFLSGIALLEAYDKKRSYKKYLTPEDEYYGVVNFDWNNIPEDDKKYTIVIRKIPKLATLHQELNDYLSRAEIILNRQIDEKQQYEALGQLFDYIDKQSDDCLIYSTCNENGETSFKWAVAKGLILPYGENKLPGVLRKFLQRVRTITSKGDNITYIGGQLDIIDGWSWGPQDGVYPALEILTWLLHTIRIEMKNLHMIWKQLPPFEYIPKHKFRYRIPIMPDEHIKGGPDVEYHYMTDDDYDERESTEDILFGEDEPSAEKTNKDTKAIKQQQIPDKKTPLPIPKAINTKRAQEYFQKAIEKGYMKVENSRFSWIGVGLKGKKSQLAYFCGLVFEYKNTIEGNNGTEFPEDELNALFGVTRLYSLLTQVYNAQKKQKWRTLIDELFE